MLYVAGKNKTQKYGYESPSALKGYKPYWAMFYCKAAGLYMAQQVKNMFIHPGANQTLSCILTALIILLLSSAGISVDQSHSHIWTAVFAQLKPTFWQCPYA